MTKAPVKAPPSGRMSLVSNLTEMPRNDHFQRRTGADLNFKVTADMRQRYRLAAAMHNKTMREVLEESFELWLREKETK